ncbi:hypothetical protein EYF80_058649 [Liparis tanakae]|uniref:Uncharacterized protein n=1 Tax=Liparis tanakae TaxID=230148 RepID=A0A4Z2ERG5_9TELE|nr:hypothetical protein EYF80_058649 [Liparis tanakae]
MRSHGALSQSNGFLSRGPVTCLGAAGGGLLVSIHELKLIPSQRSVRRGSSYACSLRVLTKVC